MAVAAGVGEPFDEDDPDALGPAGAVGGGGERLAAAVGGEAALPAELDEERGVGHHGDAADQREGALVVPQGLCGQVEGDQGGRAGGVDGDGGALEAVGVGEPAGQDAGDVAGHRVALDGARGAARVLDVAVGARADEDAGAAALEGGRVDAGPLERLPRRLQEQSLLGVHREGFAGGYPEELGVELARVVDEAALAYVALAGGVGIGVVEVVGVPAPVGGEVGDDVGPGLHQPPQVLGRADTAREAAGHGDDREGRPSVCLRGGQAAPGLLEFLGHPLEVAPQFVFRAGVVHRPRFPENGVVRVGRVAEVISPAPVPCRSG
ncbi:hypothetical protein SFUMM280S_10531 [Streptomyces fumanus]